MKASTTDLQQQLETLRLAYVERLQQDLPVLLQQAQALPDTPSELWQQHVSQLMAGLHTLAGSAGTFGLTQLGDSAKQLEQQLKHWLHDDIQPDVTTYRDFIAAIALLSRLRESGAETPAFDISASQQPVTAIIYLCCADSALKEQISVMLDIFGYANRQFTGFSALRDAVAMQRPAVVIVDADQPGVVAQLQLIQHEQKTALPLLLVSNKTDFNSYLDAVRIGAVGYYSRPLNTTELEAGVRKQLSGAEREPFRVMLVDDDQMLAQHYALVLQQGGLMVEILPQPAHIFDALNRFHPDVILLDVNMPFCSGPELAQLVRLQQSWLGVPIIYLSSETDSEQQLAALIKAGDDFITKPISDTALLVAVFARAQRARQLAEIMTRDSLTGLLQHAHIKERLALEMLRSERNSQPVSVVMLDIDHFKKVNDNYGHLVGDQVIANLANLLKQQLRKTDLVGRYGGEEFLLVLPECTLQRAFEVIEQIRELFAGLPFSSNEQRFFCTFSAGISAVAGITAADVVIEKADQALYKAKTSGRNRVILAQPPAAG